MATKCFGGNDPSRRRHRWPEDTLERSEHIAEWIRLTEKSATEENQVVQPASPEKEVGYKKPPAQKKSGVREAARKLGVEHRDARRAVKIDGISPEAKQAARNAGLGKNQSALLKVAAVPVDEQVAKVDAIKVERARPHAAEKKPEKPLSDRQLRKQATDAEVAEVIAALEDALGSRFEEIALLLCNVSLDRLYEKLVERLPD